MVLNDRIPICKEGQLWALSHPAPSLPSPGSQLHTTHEEEAGRVGNWMAPGARGEWERGAWDLGNVGISAS